MSAIDQDIAAQQAIIDTAQLAISSLKRKRDAAPTEQSAETAHWFGVFANAEQWREFVNRYTAATTKKLVDSFQKQAFTKADSRLMAKQYVLTEAELTFVFTFARDNDMSVFRVEDGMPIAFQKFDYWEGKGLGPMHTLLSEEVRPRIPSIGTNCSSLSGRVEMLIWLEKTGPYPSPDKLRAWVKQLRQFTECP